MLRMTALRFVVCCLHGIVAEWNGELITSVASQEHVLAAYSHVKQSCLGHIPDGALAMIRSSLEDVGQRVIPRLVEEANRCVAVLSRSARV